MKTVIIIFGILLLSKQPALAQETNDTISSKTFQIMETDSMPIFKGGYNALVSYIDTNFVFPAIYSDASIQGKIICRFLVKTDGSISNIKVIQSIDKELDNEIVRVITSMPRWLPGKRKGKAVEVEYFLPIICIAK